jgi:hypothetical protein
MKLWIIAVLGLLIGCTEKHVTNNYGPVDWQPPVIDWLTQPDAEVRGTVGIDCRVVDSSAVASVELYLDGVLDTVTTEARPRFELVTDSLLDGVHWLEARAQDEYGNLEVSPILRINVANSIAQGPRLIWVPDNFARIQDAINAAIDFDTIRVRDGTYYETLNLFGKGIWLESEHGPTRCSVNGGDWHETVFLPPTEHTITLRGFTVTAGYIVTFVDDGSQVGLYNCIFAEYYPADSSNFLLICGSVGGSIRNCLFMGSRTAVQTFTFLGDIQNSVFLDTWNTALWNTGRGENPLAHIYNIFWNNGSDYNGFAQGIGEVVADPRIDLPGERLRPDSPCINAGNPAILDIDSSRSDIGPFGGPWAYTLQGP